MKALLRWLFLQLGYDVIRHVENASDSSLLPLAIYLDGCLGAIVEDNDIFGDGVNVSARLEGLAEPGTAYPRGSLVPRPRITST